jgi:hypothetical protein
MPKSWYPFTASAKQRLFFIRHAKGIALRSGTNKVDSCRGLTLVKLRLAHRFIALPLACLAQAKDAYQPLAALRHPVTIVMK